MTKPWVGWLGFAVLAVVVLVSSCQAMGATIPPSDTFEGPKPMGVNP
ncbi:MAG: hypothetical protein AAGG47_21550 [Pseudomonadota bacterium]